MKLNRSVRTQEFSRGCQLQLVIFNFCLFSSFADCDSEEARKQELSGLHGALQGEQVSKCEERLWDHPLFSRNELFLCGKDDHPSSQTEHGQRLDVTLKQEENKLCHLPLSITAVSQVICATVHAPQPPPRSHPCLYVTVKLRIPYKHSRLQRQSISFFKYLSIFICV